MFDNTEEPVRPSIPYAGTPQYVMCDLTFNEIKLLFFFRKLDAWNAFMALEKVMERVDMIEGRLPGSIKS